MFCSVLCLLIIAGNAGSEGLDARLEQTRQYLEELENREASSEEILAGIHEHLQAARDYYNELAVREAVLTSDIRSIDQRWLVTDSSRAALEESVNGYIRFLYSRRNMVGPAVIFAPGGVSTYLRRMAVVDHMARIAAERMYLLQLSGDSLSGYRDSLEELASTVRELRLQMEDVQERIYQEEERQTILRQSLQSQIDAARDSAAAMEQRRQQLSSFVSTLSTSSSSGAPPVQEVNSNAYLSVNRGSIDWPVNGTVVRFFGVSSDPVYGTETVSDGISIAVQGTGAQVSAIGPGIILYASEFLNMGKMVVVDHSDGYYSVYAHLGNLQVNRDDMVSNGSVLGTAGILPGGRNGCYLEIRMAGDPVDPLGYLR
ncbi:hypothetical protein CSA37_12295 [Candidatus Fermentibacteria bacterium]|nr:MAG: hypothetical protein CSA37_12295 [Candidatus Fermentibacteria bacterium]